MSTFPNISCRFCHFVSIGIYENNFFWSTYDYIYCQLQNNIFLSFKGNSEYFKTTYSLQSNAKIEFYKPVASEYKVRL